VRDWENKTRGVWGTDNKAKRVWGTEKGKQEECDKVGK